MNESHRFPWIVGPDRDCRQVEGTELTTDLLKDIRVGRITAEPEFATLEWQKKVERATIVPLPNTGSPRYPSQLIRVDIKCI